MKLHKLRHNACAACCVEPMPKTTKDLEVKTAFFRGSTIRDGPCLTCPQTFLHSPKIAQPSRKSRIRAASSLPFGRKCACLTCRKGRWNKKARVDGGALTCALACDFDDDEVSPAGEMNNGTGETLICSPSVEHTHGFLSDANLLNAE